MNKPTFDFASALKQLQSGQALTGKDGILTPLIKQLTEAALEAEIEHYFEQEQPQCQIHCKTEPQLWSKIEPPYERCFIR